MLDTTARPRMVARCVTVALWGVGSAYLIKAETDWLAYTTIPIVWAVVISLPILAAHARRERHWLAFVLLWVAAILGCLYTLQGTLGRNAAARDAAVVSPAVLADLATAKRNRDDAIIRCGQGKTCSDSTRELIAIYSRQVAAHEAKVAVTSHSATERRIAALLTFASGADPAKVAEIVGLLLPALFGVVIELAAFAAAMYGWHPVRRLPVFSAPAKVAKHPVIAALEVAGRPVNNGELAKLMGVCDGEATKRRAEVANVVKSWRSGREVMVALP